MMAKYWCVGLVLVSCWVSGTVSTPACPSPCRCETRKNKDMVICSNMGLKSMPSLNNLLERTRQVEAVLLDGNDISVIGGYTFRDLNISRLDLSNNSISEIALKAFYGLRGLTDLNLANNMGLRSIPEAVRNLRGLKKLNLRNIVMSEITEGMLSNMTELQELDVSDNTLTIGRNTGRVLTNLVYLNLEKTGRKHVPTEIIQFTKKLERLILRYNRITLVPANLNITLPRLTELDLSENIVSLDGDQPFQRFENMTILKFSNCEVSRINGETFGHLSKLTNLTVANCNVENVADNSFSGLTKLKNLDIGENAFNFTEGVLNGLEDTLDTLSLRGLRMTTFPKELLARFTKLQEIRLEKNNMTRLDRAQFDTLHMPNTRIHLGKNQIAVINQKFAEDAKVPMSLYLQDNHLQDLDFLSVNTCQFDKIHVDVSGNNITCNCKTLKLVQQKVVDLVGQCQSPAMYQGLKLNYKSNYTTRSNPGQDVIVVSDGTTISQSPRQYLERVATEQCRGIQNRTHQEYSCPCKQWKLIGKPDACQSTSASPTASTRVTGTAFLVINVITILVALIASELNR